MRARERTYVDIRLSHLLRDCSVGAIVRHGKALMVVQDTRDWDGPNTSPYDREIRYVDLVRRALELGDRKLCRPPVKEEKGSLVQGWVKARRFPEWARCSRCGLLHNRPWREADVGDSAGDAGEETRRQSAGPGRQYCVGPRRRAAGPPSDGVAEGEGGCGGTLEQAPWVLVHEAGYLADVPWHAIAHDRAANPAQSECAPDWTQPYLKVENEEGRWSVRCDRCGSERRLSDRFPFGAATRQQPWLSEPPAEAPEEPGWLVGVNDVRVHFAETRTALVIPPESRIRRGSVVDRLYNTPADRDAVLRAVNENLRRYEIRRLAGKYRCRPEDIEAELREIDDGYPLYGQQLPRGDLAELEYGALTRPIPELQPDESFVTEHHSDAWRRLADALKGELAAVAVSVDRLVAVHRLKEIMVFDGFRRGWGSGDERRPVTPPDIVGESDWVPALELWGEGMFFAFDEEVVRRWEAQESVWSRAEEFVRRAEEAPLPKAIQETLSPRFLLCHTLAHLIVRRLETQAGYPAASLKERIYCSAGHDGKPMAGVLIYVAVADEHGSLGGLMEQAQPESFLRLLAGAVQDAAWCSLDPVCAEQEGHGPDLLNRAACHACALVPEPSCVCGNRLLDRAFVNGDRKELRSLWDLAAG